jgi:molybdate transport system substrate-binding protein
MKRRSGVALFAALALMAAACGGDDDTDDASSSKDGAKTEAAQPVADKPDPAVKEILIGGASDLRFAFEEIGRLYTEVTGTKATFTFGSSGQLASQIVNGGPFDVFASADIAFVDKVIDADQAEADTKATYAFGRIVIWTPERPNAADELIDLKDPSYRTIAVANPEHAPYGRAAVAALKSAGAYDAVQPRLVYGENVSDTLRIATSGNAEAAIVALSLVLGPDQTGRYSVVPEDLHPPLEQGLVVTADDPAQLAAARRFVELVDSDEGRKIMRRYGFLLPGEKAPDGAAAGTSGG